MISEEEIKHIAKLARLELTEKEIKKMQKDLFAILDYFNLLKKARPEGAGRARPKGVAAPKENILRKDEADLSESAGEIIRLAPDKSDGYIKVKTIL